ncbi:hypothetical protein [Bradyrhizobium erythrophlei]|nr:hypothetical protein [Bradyrhizobium erythrophlei]
MDDAPTNVTGDPITCPVVLNLLAKPLFAERRSGIATKTFLPGESKRDGVPFKASPAIPYLGPPKHREPNDRQRRGAWQLQEEYLKDRLGRNKEENSRLWNTAIWIDRHYRVLMTPAKALPPLNIYVGDKISQSREGTGAPTGPDDEAPDEAANEGFEFESINVGDEGGKSGMRVMDEHGTTRRLEIKADDYSVIRLLDALNEIDDRSKIDVSGLIREAPPLLPQTDFPSSDQRAESGQIVRMLKLEMRSLWHPVIRAIAHHATMSSLGKTQGVGDGVAAAVGRQRVIEGLRVAESIRKGRGRPEFVSRRTLEPSYSVTTCLYGILRDILTHLAGETLDNRRATWPPYRDWPASSCYINGKSFLRSMPFAANDNHGAIATICDAA